MNIFKIATLSLLIISFAACKRDYTESPGKATNISASSSFTSSTFTVSGDADFPLDIKPSFSVTFSETVTWKIELTGQNSTATKTISGTSSVINAANSTWIGNHDGLYFFEKGEKVTANLIISGKAGVFASTTFTIAGARDTKTATPTFMLVSNSSDFETTGSYPSQFGIGGSQVYTPQNDKIRAPEGVQYLHLEGVSAETNGFFVGGLQFRRNTIASTTFFPPAWTDPDKIYLNIYIRGIDNLPAGNLPYANLNFECHEDDNKNLSTTTNCSYYANRPGPPTNNPDHFCPSSEDSWVFKVPVRHTGWQLFSCKYSDLLPSEDFANGGFGNRKLEPQKVCRVQLGMVSSPPFNRVSIDLDYACFTYGAPFDPKK
jgi:hypothetical protein